MRITKPTIIFFCLLLFVSCKPDNSLYKASRLNEEAFRLMDAGKVEDAIPLYYQAISFTTVPDSNKSIYYSNIATAYNALGNFDSAKFFLRKAIEVIPKGSCEYYTQYARIFLLDSLTEKAITSLEKAYSLNPNYMLANNLLGLIYMGIYGMEFYDPHKALPYNRKAIELVSDNSGKLILAQNYYYLEMTERSVALFKEMYRDYPLDIDCLSTIIMIEQELDNKNEAEFYLEKMKTLSPETYENLIKDPVKVGTHNLTWGE